MADQLGLVIPSLIESEKDLAPLIDDLEGVARLALDTEFHPERRRTPKLYVVSIKPEGASPYLVDGTQAELLSALGPHMESKTWVVHGGRHDIRLLEPFFGRPSHLFDTQIAAGLCTSAYPARFEQLLETFLQASPEPAATMSDWSVRPLSTIQRRYAAGDVDRLLDLADAISQRVADMGRTASLEAATSEFLAGLDNTSTNWRAIRGSETLPARSIALLQELVTLRDRIAAETTSAPNAILGDGHLLDLAKRYPLTTESVGANRRFPRKFATAYGEEIAEIAQRVARRSPERLPPSFERGSQAEAAKAWWWAAALMEGRAQQWGARLVLPPAELEKLVSGMPTRAWTGPILSTWIELKTEQFLAMRRADRHPLAY